MSVQREALQIFLDNKLQISKKALDLLVEQEKPLELAQVLSKNADPNLVTIEPNHIISLQEEQLKPLPIIDGYVKNNPIKNVQDLSDFFNNRYTYFRKHLSGRMVAPTALAGLKKRQNEKTSTIGLVIDKRTTKNGNILFEIEDPTSTLRMVATKPDVKKEADKLVMDEIIGVSGTMGDGIFFVDEIQWPDIPIRPEPKKLSTESYALFLSDTHIGSNKFMDKEFNRFLSWVNGEVGGEAQAELAKKIKYCFVAGDIVDGVGVYPNQNKELAITDIKGQYEAAAELFSKIPKHIKIILSPGNHDFIRGGQPQPPLDPEFAAPLYEIRNAEFVGNPATVTIEEHDRGGLNILMYHGVSFDTMITSDPSLKEGYTQPDKVMISLLKRRHLSPPYDTGLVACGDDHMIIRNVPDIFHTGHVHSNGNGMYRGTTIINSGTWQSQTSFQKLCGHEPTPCILPMLNLNTRELNLMNFNYQDEN